MYSNFLFIFPSFIQKFSLVSLGNFPFSTLYIALHPSVNYGKLF